MYQRILIPVDGSSAGQQALQALPHIAAKNAAVCLLYVVENFYPLDAESMVMFDYKQLQTALHETGQRVLQTAATQLAEHPFQLESILIEASELRIAEAINRQAKEWRAELIVMATHGRTGLNRLLMGSVAEGVLRAANVPVLLLRSQ